MFVGQGKYDRAVERAARAEAAFYGLQKKWNKLVDQVNKKGGKHFLNNATLNPALQFDADEIGKLVMLCHPDKHDGKPMATEMTQKLLALKNALAA